MVDHLSSVSDFWHHSAQEWLLTKNYDEAQKVYELLIEDEPECRRYYWHLGLLYLLQGNEGIAQTTWFMVFSEADSDEESTQWLHELLTILDEEAGYQQTIEEHQTAWIIRQHIREFDPSNSNNILLLIQLSVALERLSIDDLAEWQIVELLKQKPLSVHPTLLSTTLATLLELAPWDATVFEILEQSTHAFQDDPQPLVDILMDHSSRIGHGEQSPSHGARLLELATKIDPENIDVLRNLSVLYQNSHQHEKGIEIGRLIYQKATTLLEKIMTSGVLLRGLLAVGGHWNEVNQVFQEQLEYFDQLIEENPTDLSRQNARYLLNAAFFQPYLRDDLAGNRYIQNNLARLGQTNSRKHLKDLADRFKTRSSNASQLGQRPLKVGYISACLRQHSVGWLARWLYEHHNRDQFKIYSYLVSYRFHGDDHLRDWYVKKSDVVHKLDSNTPTIAEQIFEDEIDILVDLDSTTLDTTCEVMALKPAPVQASWLGWDAPGLPAIDYYLVDPYVLADGAEKYYEEKLWRLPQTYLAVDGFEVGVPTLHRSDLDIPNDAIVYLSAQRGHKRYPPTVRLQMKILKQVPNSYFLVKSPEADGSLRQSFLDIAAAEGVSGDRLRFMPDVPSELEHRANLAIADVVLDTYPYSGATTTLETLWMETPLVTRVGETFSSRNSYTMMANVGVLEGVAWTDEEYINWGVRLGQDETLRQQISWKLRQAKQTAPLWNGQLFTREVENAYKQMCMNASD